MSRYRCPSCAEVVEGGSSRFAFCTACGGPLTAVDVVPVLRRFHDARTDEAAREQSQLFQPHPTP